MADIQPVMAIDCDLRRMYAWCSYCGQVCREAPDAGTIKAHVKGHKDLTVLYEISDALGYQHVNGRSAAFQFARWGLWNIATAADLVHAVPGLLVSPSHRWTKGYNVKLRHLAARAQSGQKDLRECETMIWMYRQAPEDWVPYAEHLKRI